MGIAGDMEAGFLQQDALPVANQGKKSRRNIRR